MARAHSMNRRPLDGPLQRRCRHSTPQAFGLGQDFKSKYLKSQIFCTFLAAAWAAALVPFSATATNFDPEFAVANDFGNVGLMQTPTARMRDDGTLGFGVSVVTPYNQAHAFLQLLPWMETTVRYTNVLSRSYGPLATAYGNSQHYKDKSADVKVRLLQEGQYWPSVALGFQDIGGTGLFSSEYLVGSYHYYDLDFSFGLGWGRLGAGGDIPNPFGAALHHFRQPRSVANSTSSTPGNLGVNRLFTGNTIGPFGGVEWNTPIKHLKLQVEYDGNDYEHEALGLKIAQATPVNVGLSYEPVKGVQLGVGYERGNKLTARLDLGMDLNRLLGMPKVSDPRPPAVAPPEPLPVQESAGGDVAAAPSSASQSVPTPAADIAAADLQAFVLVLKSKLTDQSIEFVGLNYVPVRSELVVWFEQDKYRDPAKAAGRVARVLSNVAPPQARQFVLVNVQSGVETYRVSVSRRDFQSAAAGNIDLSALLEKTVVSGPDARSLSHAQFIDDSRFPKFSWDTAPALRQNVGGPDQFYATQFWWRFDGSMAVSDHWSFDGTIGINVWNNFDKLQQPSNSLLPHVRSDIASYLKDGPNNLVRLETNYIWSPFNDIYARGSLGIFEEMYGGVAGEVLYRPFGRRWAIGLDVNYLRQRAFTERFNFRNYKVMSGFATLYYEVPYYNILAQVTVGRYLAKDKGGTIDLSRRFANGVRCGMFATKTNVSSAQFGEGSFDKGLYISIPLDLFFTTSTRNVGTTAFRPLTRDGGQRAADGTQLYWATTDSSAEDFARGAGDFLH